MGYVHLVNCLLLTFGPLNVVYRARKLNEQNGYSLVMMSVICFILTSAFKTILMAFVMFDYLKHDWIKILFNMCDVMGLGLLVDMRRTNFDPKINRILAIALGWSLAESFFNHFFSFLLHAQSDVFQWNSIVIALLSNLDFFDNIGLVGLVIVLQRLNKQAVQNGRFYLTLLLLVSKQVVLPMMNLYLWSEQDMLCNIVYRTTFSFVFYIIVLFNDAYY